MNKRMFLKTCASGIASLFIPSQLYALKFYPTVANTEWAILYSTWCGTARDAGVWISEGMDGIADVYDIREKPDLSKYKHIVVGGSIRNGETSKALQEYIVNNRELLRNKIRGLFVVCGNMRQPVTDEQYKNFIKNHLEKLTQTEGVPSRVFLGRITWGLLEPEVREQLKTFLQMEDYDNLKRSECLAFGREVLKAVKN